MANNKAEVVVGGLLVHQEVSVSHPILINNIIWGNNTNELGEQKQIIVEAGSVTVRYSNIQGGYEGEGNIDVDPLFADSLFTLSDSSRCIGAGIHSIQIGEDWYDCPERCFSGHPRPSPQGTMPDLGAQEHVLGSPTDIPQIREKQPGICTLHQNYPNPFNPTTTIEFALPQSEFTTVKVYNILGKEVANIVSAKLQQGKHTYTFDGSHLASGLYYCQLVAGHYHEVRKMLLVK